MLIAPIVAAAPREGGDMQPALEQIVRAVRVHLGMEVGFISEFREGRRVFRHVESADGSACIEVGASDPLEESYCYWIVQGKLPQLIQDPSDHPFTERFPATAALPIGAHMSVPIRMRDGTVYGTFCCFSFTPDRSLTARDLATMEAFAQVASEQIQESIDRDRERKARVSKVSAVLRSGDLQMVYQPAIRLDAPKVAFVEALARFYAKPYQPPDRWFAMAAEVGLGTELEILAARTALRELHLLPEGTSLSINVSPETLVSSDLVSTLNGVPPERIILELTEHETVGSYGLLGRALQPLRARGVRIAVDDTGAGFSSFRHILHLQPDLIKLDMSLSRGIDADPARRALASALTGFAREIGSELVAEGVETDAELATLSALGVKIVQGFLLGRPEPAPAAAAAIAW